jgi:hypothetical protein
MHARSSNVGAFEQRPSNVVKSRKDFETLTVIMRSIKPRLSLPPSFFPGIKKHHDRYAAKWHLM